MENVFLEVDGMESEVVEVMNDVKTMETMEDRMKKKLQRGLGLLLDGVAVSSLFVVSIVIVVSIFEAKYSYVVGELNKEQMTFFWGWAIISNFILYFLWGFVGTFLAYKTRLEVSDALNISFLGAFLVLGSMLLFLIEGVVFALKGGITIFFLYAFFVAFPIYIGRSHANKLFQK